MARRPKRASPKRRAAPDVDAGSPRRAARGRPPKFGRPSQVVALTLPQEVLDALRTIHRDLGWAIVRLVEPILSDGGQRRRPPGPAPLAELVHLPGRRALNVVQPEVFTPLRGVSHIQLADGRAFLAFDRAGGLADLEVAILDPLELVPPKSAERGPLLQLRDIVRGWRRDPGLAFRAKSIIVAEGVGGADRRPLAALKNAEPARTQTVEEDRE